MKKTGNFTLSILILLLLVSFTDAAVQSLGYFKIGDCINLPQTCATCTYVNISSIMWPNSTKVMINTPMTKTGAEYNYTYCPPNVTGSYIATTCGDAGGTFSCANYDFTITGNGLAPPTGIVITFFAILFLIIIGTLAYLIVYDLGHAINLDFDIIDLAWNYGVYFGLVAVYILGNNYLGNVFIENILSWIVDIGAITNIMLPTIYLILTLTIGSWMKRRVKGIDY